jgi:hypothetical protein
MPIADPEAMTGLTEEELDAFLEAEEERAAAALVEERFELLATATDLKRRAATLLAAAKDYADRAEANKDRLGLWVERTGRKLYRHPLATYRIATQGGTPAVEVLVPVDALPLEFQDWRPTIKKSAIADLLEPGGELVDPTTGAVIARMGLRGKVVQEHGVVREGE